MNNEGRDLIAEMSEESKCLNRRLSDNLMDSKIRFALDHKVVAENAFKNGLRLRRGMFKGTPQEFALHAIEEMHELIGQLQFRLHGYEVEEREWKAKLSDANRWARSLEERLSKCKCTEEQNRQ